jgi:hypothetical protein
MSVRLMTLVYEAEVGSLKYQEESGEVRTLSQPDKAVLLAMADCAADDGSSVFLGVERLTWKTELSERSVRESLRHLRLAGLVIITKPASQHRPTRYRINVALIRGARRTGPDDEPGVQEAQVSDESGVQEAQVSEPRGAAGAARGAAGAPYPSVTVSKVQGNRQKKQSNQSPKQHHAPENGAVEDVQVDGLLGGAVAVDAARGVPTGSARPAEVTHTAAAPGASDPAPPGPAAHLSPAVAQGAPTPAPPARRGHPAVAAYCDAWRTRYGANPIINGKDAGTLTRLAKVIGADYQGCLAGYFADDDPFLVKAAHPAALFETRLNALRVNPNWHGQTQGINKKWAGRTVREIGR